MTVALPGAPRGTLPHRRRLLRIVVLAWGAAIAFASALSGHSALELVLFELPVICGAWLAHSPRTGGRIGAAGLALALIAVAASSALIVDDIAAAMTFFAAALVMACWLEDRLATLAALLATALVQAACGPLTPDTTDLSGIAIARVLLLAGVVLAAVGPWKYNAKREADLKRDRQALQQLVDVSRRVATHENPRGALVQGVLEFADAQIVSLCQLCDDERSLQITASTLPTVVGTTFPLDGESSGTASAFRAGESLLIDDAAGSPLVNQQLVTSTGVRTILYEVVRIDGNPAGVLAVAWTQPADDSARHRRSLVELAAGEAATAIRRHATEQDLHQQALTDALTRAPNRRAFDDALPTALASATARNMPVAVAMMDLNAFKQLNDTEGHDAGDRVLHQCAEAWQAELRPQDFLARLGGDEFAIILPDLTTAHTGAVTQRLRRAARDRARIGTGIGIAIWDGNETPLELMRRADQLLYADKAANKPVRPEAALNLAINPSAMAALPTDPELRRLCDTLAETTGAPIAMLSLIEREAQHVLARSGTDEPSQTLCLPDSYCHYPATTGRELIIEDTTKTPALANHPATIDHGARAYAGIPITVDGATLGVACAIDTHPRPWTQEQLTALRIAAKHITRYLTTPARNKTQAATGPARSAVGACAEPATSVGQGGARRERQRPS